MIAAHVQGPIASRVNLRACGNAVGSGQFCKERVRSGWNVGPEYHRCGARAESKMSWEKI